MKDLSFSGNSPKKAVKQRRKPKKLQDPNLDETALEQESFVSQTSNGEPLEDVIPKKAKKRTSVEVELKSDDSPLKPKKKKQKPVEVEQNDDVPPPKPKEKKQKPVEVEQKDDAPPKSKEKKQKLKQNGGPVKGINNLRSFLI
jgi:hypothetical protein